MFRSSWLAVMSRKVIVRFLLVVALRDLDRIPGVDVVDVPRPDPTWSTSRQGMMRFESKLVVSLMTALASPASRAATAARLRRDRRHPCRSRDRRSRRRCPSPLRGKSTTSWTVATPPETITGIESASASAAVGCSVGQHAVPGDVGVDDRRDASVFETLAQLDRRRLARLEPALDRDPAVPRVDPDDDFSGAPPPPS